MIMTAYASDADFVISYFDETDTALHGVLVDRGESITGGIRSEDILHHTYVSRERRMPRSSANTIRSYNDDG